MLVGITAIKKESKQCGILFTDFLPGIPDANIRFNKSQLMETFTNKLNININCVPNKVSRIEFNILENKKECLVPNMTIIDDVNEENVYTKLKCTKFTTIFDEFKTFIRSYRNKTNSEKHHFSPRTNTKTPVTFFTIPHKEIIDLILESNLFFSFMDRIKKIHNARYELDISNDKFFLNTLSIIVIKNNIKYYADKIVFNVTNHDYLNMLGESVNEKRVNDKELIMMLCKISVLVIKEIPEMKVKDGIFYRQEFKKKFCELYGKQAFTTFDEMFSNNLDKIKTVFFDNVFLTCKIDIRDKE